EGGGDDGAKAIVQQCPWRVLPRAAAPEVQSREQDLSALIARRVQHEVWIERSLRVVHSRLSAIEVTPGIEQIRAEARSIDRLEELFRDDDVGVDVGTVERSHQSSQDAKGLHQ